jgi:hypothetical protein
MAHAPSEGCAGELQCSVAIDAGLVLADFGRHERFPDCELKTSVRLRVGALIPLLTIASRWGVVHLRTLLVASVEIRFRICRT